MFFTIFELMVPVTWNFISKGQFRATPMNLMYTVRMRYENKMIYATNVFVLLLSSPGKDWEL